MNVKTLTAREPVTRSSNIIALATQNPDGTFTVTHLLCNNFPSMTSEQLAVLSWKLCEFGKGNG